MARLILFVLVSPISSAKTAHASDVNLFGVIYTHSCGYFSNQVGQFELHYENALLPAGSLVEAHFGWGGQDHHGPEAISFQWRQPITEPGIQGDDGVWRVRISKEIASRGNPVRIDSLQFVFRLTLPDGRVYWVKGSDAERGFFVANLRSPAVSTCLNPGETPPPVEPFDFSAVLRD